MWTYLSMSQSFSSWSNYPRVLIWTNSHDRNPSFKPPNHYWTSFWPSTLIASSPHRVDFCVFCNFQRTGPIKPPTNVVMLEALTNSQLLGWSFLNKKSDGTGKVSRTPIGKKLATTPQGSNFWGMTSWKIIVLWPNGSTNRNGRQKLVLKSRNGIVISWNLKFGFSKTWKNIGLRPI